MDLSAEVQPVCHVHAEISECGRADLSCAGGCRPRGITQRAMPTEFRDGVTRHQPGFAFQNRHFQQMPRFSERSDGMRRFHPAVTCALDRRQYGIRRRRPPFRDLVRFFCREAVIPVCPVVRVAFQRNRHDGHVQRVFLRTVPADQETQIASRVQVFPEKFDFVDGTADLARAPGDQFVFAGLVPVADRQPGASFLHLFPCPVINLAVGFAAGIRTPDDAFVFQFQHGFLPFSRSVRFPRSFPRSRRVRR